MRGVSASPEVTEVLLAEAAVFLARDRGSDGFLDRFAEAVTGDPRTASLALDRALTARARAGYVAFSLEPGDLRVQNTPSGASLTACALPGRAGCVAAAVRLVDVSRRPVAGAAMEVRTESKERVVVTDLGGWVHLSEPGQALYISLGQLDAVSEADGPAEPEPARSAAAGASVIPLPRIPRPDGLELAAAHEEAGRAADETARWRGAAGGGDFLCQARKGG